MNCITINMKDKKLKEREENGFIAVFKKCPICKKDVLCMGDHPETHDKKCLMKFKEENEMHLAHCKKCNQETNHNKEGECLKCKTKKERLKYNRLETWICIFEGYDYSENCIQKSMNLSVLEQKDIFKLFEELKELREKCDYNKLTKSVLNEIEDWVICRDNVTANQEDIMNLKSRLLSRFED